MTEQPTKWVQVSTELLAELGEWSEPVRVKVVSVTDGVLDMVFERTEKPNVRDCEDPWTCCVHTPGELEEVIAEDNSPR